MDQYSGESLNSILGSRPLGPSHGIQHEAGQILGHEVAVLFALLHQSFDLSSTIFEFIREHLDELREVFGCLAIQPIEHSGDAAQCNSCGRKQLDNFYKGLRETADWRSLAFVTFVKGLQRRDWVIGWHVYVFIL